LVWWLSTWKEKLYPLCAEGALGNGGFLDRVGGPRIVWDPGGRVLSWFDWDEANTHGYEAWVVGKIMAKEKINSEAMYRVLKSLWFTKEEVSFVTLNGGVILVKFDNIEDRTRILNLMPWLFDQCLFVAIDVGKAIGEVMAIDWRDRDGGWMDFIRLRVKIDMSRPLRRVVHLVGREETETICTIKYEIKVGTRDENDIMTQKRKGDGCLPVNSEGHSGGLAMLWKEDVDVGGLDVGGDFNAIIDDAKKEGGRRKPRANMDEFRDVLEELALVDIKIDRGWFTWVNNHHDVVVMDTMGRKHREDLKDLRLFFKFDGYWAKEKEVKDIIKRAWSRDDINTIEKIEKMHKELGPWQHYRYRKMTNNIRRLAVRIDKLIDGPYEESKADRLKFVRLKLGHFYAKEESYWFMDEEILEAFNQMDPCKASGIDGLSSIFFKENW
ncbi:hypothetical protein Gohar_013359, partial [Gossypium harknessii]|nr:hypothetical protein [Gossypium harknessii]